MALNLQAAVKVTAEVLGLADLGKLEKALGGAEKAAESAGKGFKSIASSQLFQGAAVAATALSVAIGLSAKAAIDFETSFAQVTKVVSGLSTTETTALKNEIFELAKVTPVAVAGIADIYAAAGQAGVAKAELKTFAEDVAKISVAFDMTAEEAGNAMAKLRTSLGLSQPELMQLADATNHLSNNMASTAKEVVEFTLRAGQSGKIAGLSAEQTAAFGSAMIATGADVNVAATSFNNMVKALSRGPSMTDRQISALQRLGFISGDAAENEKKFTQAVEEESRKRIRAAEHETNQLSKEIDRRYRDQLRLINDGFEDQTLAFQESLRDREQAQIKGLQREERRQIEAVRKRVEAAGKIDKELSDADKKAAEQRAEAIDRSAELEIQRIQDAYEERIDIIRDSTQDQIKTQQRADRDRLQDIQDNMDDQKETELNGLKERFEATKAAEETRKKEAIAAAKLAAQQVSTGVAETLAANLQKDAIGTITDVFERIRALPAESRLSVVSDLFGDEAKALLPLINDTKLLSDALALVGDKSKYAGSTQAEYIAKVQTAAAQLQLANNNLQVLAITFGTQFVPVLLKVMEAIAPLISGLTWMIQNIPGFGPILAILSGGFIALVAVLPALGSLVFLLQSMGGLSPIFATIAGALGSLGPIILPIVAAVKGLGAVLLGVFSGPVGWVALAVAAGVAIYAFRDQIGQAFQAIGNILKIAAQVFKTAFIDPVVAGFKAVVQFVTVNFVQPVNQAITGLVEKIANTFKSVTNAITAPFKAAFTAVRGIVNQILNGIGNAVGGVVRAINNVIGGANRALARLNMPQIPYLPMPSIPQFAEGGVVTGPTLAMVGEGGEPEYIVPQSKAAGFASNFMEGRRGAAAIPKFAEGGVVMPSGSGGGSGGGGGGSKAPIVNIQTGPVVQMNGQSYVSTQDLSMAVQAGVQQTLAMLRNDINTRRAVGIA